MLRPNAFPGPTGGEDGEKELDGILTQKEEQRKAPNTSWLKNVSASSSTDFGNALRLITE